MFRRRHYCLRLLGRRRKRHLPMLLVQSTKTPTQPSTRNTHTNKVYLALESIFIHHPNHRQQKDFAWTKAKTTGRATDMQKTLVNLFDLANLYKMIATPLSCRSPRRREWGRNWDRESLGKVYKAVFLSSLVFLSINKNHPYINPFYFGSWLPFSNVHRLTLSHPSATDSSEIRLLWLLLRHSHSFSLIFLLSAVWDCVPFHLQLTPPPSTCLGANLPFDLSNRFALQGLQWSVLSLAKSLFFWPRPVKNLNCMQGRKLRRCRME